MRKREKQTELEDELRPQYDFSKMKLVGRGIYAERYRSGTNLVLLEPDVRKAFPDDESVNEALRAIANRQGSSTESLTRSEGSGKKSMRRRSPATCRMTMNAEGVRYNSPGSSAQRDTLGTRRHPKHCARPIEGRARDVFVDCYPGRCPGLLYFTPLA